MVKSKNGNLKKDLVKIKANIPIVIFIINFKRLKIILKINKIISNKISNIKVNLLIILDYLLFGKLFIFLFLVIYITPITYIKT